MTKNESSLVWELVRETTGEVLRTSHQTVEEFGLHACGPELALACVDAIPRSVLDAQNEDEIIIPDALACADVIPREMISDSNEGEWSRDGLRFVHEGQEYLVRCRFAAREEIVHDPIPEPLSLGCGLRIDAVSDRMESPTWYVGIYDGETGDWIGEVPVRLDPTRAAALVESLVDQIPVPESRWVEGPCLYRRLREGGAKCPEHPHAVYLARRGLARGLSSWRLIAWVQVHRDPRRRKRATRRVAGITERRLWRRPRGDGRRVRR